MRAEGGMTVFLDAGRESITGVLPQRKEAKSDSV
jgi:hypothetical protein